MRSFFYALIFRLTLNTVLQDGNSQFKRLPNLALARKTPATRGILVLFYSKVK